MFHFTRNHSRTPCRRAQQYDLVRPRHSAYTIYEWDRTTRSIEQHLDQFCTDAMPVSVDAGHGNGFRENFFEPRYLSFPYQRDEGVWQGEASLVVMLNVTGDADQFERWFRETQARDVLPLQHFQTAAFFKLINRQMIDAETPFKYVALFGLAHAVTAIDAWPDSEGKALLEPFEKMASDIEASCWTPAMLRLHPEALETAPASDLVAENNVRRTHAFVSREYFISMIETEVGMDLSSMRGS